MSPRWTRLMIPLGCLALCALTADVASAQGRRGGFATQVVELTRVATLEELSSEFKLTDEQSKAARRISDDASEQRREAFQGFDFQNASAEEKQERREKMETIRKESEEKLAKALGEEKFKRVEQVGLQVMGIRGAFFHPKAAEALKVRGEQRQQAEMGVGQIFQNARQAFQQAGDDEAERAKAVEGLYKQYEETLPALLTDDQKKKWKEMLGEPVAAETLAKARAALMQRPRQQ